MLLSRGFAPEAVKAKPGRGLRCESDEIVEVAIDHRHVVDHGVGKERLGALVGTREEPVVRSLRLHSLKRHRLLLEHDVHVQLLAKSEEKAGPGLHRRADTPHGYRVRPADLEAADEVPAFSARQPMHRDAGRLIRHHDLDAGDPVPSLVENASADRGRGRPLRGGAPAQNPRANSKADARDSRRDAERATRHRHLAV